MNYPPPHIRKRVPFKTSDDDEGEPRILDEQEQEELVNTLRTKSLAANEQYVLGVRVVVGLSCVLHFISLRNTDITPISAILSMFPSSPPILLPGLFTWLQISVHIALIARSFPVLESSIQSFTPPWNFELCCAIASVIPPAMSLLLQRSWAHFLWWIFAPVLVGLDALTRRWIKQDEKNIIELEKLKYDAKGA